MESLLTLEGIRVESGSQTLLALDRLDVRRGETLAVLGPTGAGKSTLLRVINGLIEPAAGRLLWEGKPVSRPMPLALRRRMAMAFQEPLLFRGTVFDNIAWGLRIRGLPRGQLRAEVAKALHALAIEHLEKRSCRELSGGEAHRVSLARVLVLRPELLLLDEPLASLDAVTREQLGDHLLRLIRGEQLTCVYVTHDQIEARAVADRIVVVDRGAVLQQGGPDDIFLRPATERVARFVQTRNLLPGEVVRQEEGIADIRVGEHVLQAVSESKPGDRVIVCIRPEHVILARTSSDSSARNRIQCTVSTIRARGPVVEVLCHSGLELAVLVTRRALDDLSLCEGDVVEASFKATAVHVVDPTEVPPDAPRQ